MSPTQPTDKSKEGKAKKLKEGSDRTPEGHPICFRYNAKGCKNGDKCHFVEPATKCPQKAPPAKPDAIGTTKTDLASYLRHRYSATLRPRPWLQTLRCPRWRHLEIVARYVCSTCFRAQPAS